jgi:organic hydroperoxide reductase OsmC/OhrA
MQISATVEHSPTRHDVTVCTGSASQSLAVPAKAGGGGSAVNGGEFLMLALATCYCNDLYREAKRLGITLEGARVEASAEFTGVGLAATNIRSLRKHRPRPLPSCCAKPTPWPRCTTPRARAFRWS